MKGGGAFPADTPPPTIENLTLLFRQFSVFNRNAFCSVSRFFPLICVDGCSRNTGTRDVFMKGRRKKTPSVYGHVSRLPKHMRKKTTAKTTAKTTKEIRKHCFWKLNLGCHVANYLKSSTNGNSSISFCLSLYVVWRMSSFICLFMYSLIYVHPVS